MLKGRIWLDDVFVGIEKKKRVMKNGKKLRGISRNCHWYSHKREIGLPISGVREQTKREDDFEHFREAHRAGIDTGS